MSVMGGNDLTVKVDATTKGYEAAIARAQQATQRYDTSLKSLEADLMALEKSLDDKVNAALKRQHEAMTTAGKGMLVFGAAVMTGVGMAVNEAMKWESAWTGVTKTVNGSAAEMGQLEGQLRQLAKTLPASHEEIAAVAEAAGQLGVKRQDIAGFTKVMIDLGQTTNLSADEAATSIAQLMNVMRTAPDKVDEIGSTLVALGNAGASTEADIMSLAQRLSGIGALTGASEADVLALASAMANLGIQSELGGGAASRVLTTLYSTVKSGGPILEKTARIAGMTGQQFVKAFGADPIRAFDAFNQGLGRIKDSGGNVVQQLHDVGISGTQNLQVMLRLAGAGTELTDSLDLSARAWDKNNALINEANKRYETTASKVAVARNNLKDAAIDVGSTLLPALASVAGVLADFAAAWSHLPGPIKTAGTVLVIAAGAIALFGGAALVAIPKVAAFKAAVEGLEAGALKTAGTKLLGLGSILTGPWGIALAAGVTALGIFAAKQGAAAREVDALKATLDEQTGAITDNSREWAVKKLADSGALDKAKDLGLNLAQVTDAALGNKDAIAAVNKELIHYKALGAPTDDSGQFTGQGKAANDLQKILLGVNGTVRDGRQAWQLQNEAMGGATKSTKGATSAAKGMTGTLQDTAGATGDLTQEVKTLGDELHDLSSDYLDSRDAGRQVRQSLREIRDQMRQYTKDHGNLRGAFKAGTKSGDEFAGMLDKLASDYQHQIAATEKVSASEKKTQAVYDRSRAKLVEVARQLGMSKTAANRYADAVLGVPGSVATHFATPGLNAAQSDVRHYGNVLDGLPRYIATQMVTRHIDKFERQTAKADGGIVQAFAAGGFASDGRYVERKPQIVKGGANILWGEPETGWEAYISGKPGQRDRNRDIWLEAGRRLGLIDNAGNLQQMHAARTFAAGGLAGGGVVDAVMRLTSAQGRSDGLGASGRPIALTITNWRTGEGYIRELAASEVADAGALATSRGRMNR